MVNITFIVIWEMVYDCFTHIIYFLRNLFALQGDMSEILIELISPGSNGLQLEIFHELLSLITIKRYQ